MTAFRNLVREDSTGIYVVTNGTKFRPGDINGYSHANRMDDAGLKAGDKVKATHRATTSTAWIKTQSGNKLLWGSDYDHMREQERAQYLKDHPETLEQRQQALGKLNIVVPRRINAPSR